MIDKFEKYTAELSELEHKKVVPEVAAILRGRVGKWNAITNKQIVGLLRARYIETDEPRVRKVVHFLRETGGVRWLVASSVGYYVAQTLGEMEAYVATLKSRENSIRAVREAIEKQMDGTLF